VTLLSKAGEALVEACKCDADEGIALLIKAAANARAAGLTMRFNYPSGFDPDPSKIGFKISCEV